MMNLHTHTVYCDGRDTPEEMVQAALEKGFEVLGFSGHSYTRFDESYCMSREQTKAYQREIGRLKAKYAGQIKILCGIEQDFYSREPVSGYDYAIGSVHYVYHDGTYYPVDESPEKLRQAIKAWGSDPYAFAEAYYRTIARFSERPDIPIIGHFDVVTKFNREGAFLDESSDRYRNAARAALIKLIEAGKCFEINTGAMAKGLLSRPYPDFWLLDILAEKEAPLVLSSDCHDARLLDYGFSDERLRKYFRQGSLMP